MILKSIIPEISLPLIKNIETHIESKAFRKQFQLCHYTQKYSWTCLHVWFLKNRIDKKQRLSQIYIANKTKRSLFRLLQVVTKNHVYEYQQHFDRSVYEQLERIKETMFWSLDDYFLYDFKIKTFEQIIQEDLCLTYNKSGSPLDQKNQLQISKLLLRQKTATYILNNIRQLQRFNISSIYSNNFQWKI